MNIQNLDKTYDRLIQASSCLKLPFMLAARLYRGWQFMQTRSLL